MRLIRIVFLSLLLLISAQAQTAPVANKIAFMRGEYIYVQDARTKSIRRVARGFDPHLSPDGKQLAYTENGNGKSAPDRKIRIVEIATGKARDLLPGLIYIHYGARWSPDGKRIAAHVFFEGGISSRWVMAIFDLTTGKWTHCLPSKADGVYLSSWTADGQSVIGHDLSTIYQADLNGKELRHWKIEDVIGNLDVDSSARFSLSPDGKQFLFDVSVPDEEDLDGHEIRSVFTYDLTTRRRQRITPASLIAINPNWLPFSEIAFEAYPARRKYLYYSFYKAIPGAAKPELILRNATDVSISFVPN